MLLVVTALIVLFPLVAAAQLTISSPAAGNTAVSYCRDYFTDEWGVRLDMSGASNGALMDIPGLQTNTHAGGLGYSNGILSFTSAGAAPLLTFLQYTVQGSLAVGTRYGENHPIDSASYRLLTFRMYASESSIGSIRWFQAYDRYATTTFNVFAGWHIYSIDMGSATIASSTGSNVGWLEDSPEGIEIYPVNETGVSVSFDWLQLTRNDCTGPTVNYTATAAANDNRVAIFADDNGDISDGVLAELIVGSASGAASTTVPASRLFPGTNYQVYGYLSGDFATLELRNPFDMSDSEDLKISSAYQMSGTSFSGGRFSGVTTGTDPSIFLNLRDGQTIDASTYKFVSIGVEYTGIVSDLIQLYFFNAAGDTLVGQKLVTALPGYNIYQFELTPGDGWSGEIGSIRFDPVNASGVTFSLDFIAIRQAGYVNSLAAPTLTSAPGSFLVNDLLFSVLQPDKRGGRDWAQNTMSNAWNMDSASDLQFIFNVTSASIYPFNDLIDESSTTSTGDFLYAVNIPFNGDANYISLNNNASISPATFVNVCFRGWNETESPSGFNSVARILWQDPREGNADSSYKSGDDIIMNRGAREYCVDMRTQAQIEPALPPGSANPWTSIGDAGQSITYFRVDMNENEEAASAAYYSVIDYITVRTDHESNTRYAIVVSAPTSQVVDLYYNTVNSTSGGTPIGSLAAGRSSNVYLWDTTAIPEGTYYILGQGQKNSNVLTRLADGRVNISHSRAQDSTSPVLTCERPFNGYTFDTQLELAGYALDETRLAALEVLIDDVYSTSITPSRYHVDAHTNYGNYAEVNNPGFQQVISTTGLAPGAHTVKLVATDTAGNQSSCTLSVTKQAGASTDLLAYPAANGSPITLTVNGVSPTPTATPDPAPNLALQLQKKIDLRFTITNAASCSSVTLQGATTNAFTDARTLYTGAGGSTVSLLAKSLPPFKAAAVKSKKKKEDGKVFFRALCGATAGSSSTLSLKSVKNSKKKTVTKEATFVKGVKPKRV